MNEAFEAIISKAKQIGILENSNISPSGRTNLYNMIEMACDPAHSELDMAVALEICDLINQKQASAPREAAFTILKFVHSIDNHQAMLALNLLDTMAKNCGFPFHVQIGTKEFLNELVKRFPDKPPPFSDKRNFVNERILGLIQQWNLEIYEQSKYKQDLIHINDMHRLLSFKGYKFPAAKNMQIFKENESLKTRDELEKEDRMVQEARLQKLLAEGTPEAFDKANELMKVMTGFYHDKNPNYEKKETQELEKMEEKVALLKEMLEQIPPGTSVTDNDVLQELLGIVKTSQPKVLKYIEDGAEDSRLDKLLFLNDSMNVALTKYEELKVASGASSGSRPTRESNNLAPAGTMTVNLPGVKSTTVSNATSPNVQPKKQTEENWLVDLQGLSFQGPPQAQAAPGFQPIQLPLSNQPLQPQLADSSVNSQVQKSKLKQDILGLFGNASQPLQAGAYPQQQQQPVPQSNFVLTGAPYSQAPVGRPATLVQPKQQNPPNTNAQPQQQPPSNNNNFSLLD